MGRIIERTYPYIGSLMLSIFYFNFTSEETQQKIMANMPNLLNISISISSIFIGVLGAMVGVILALANTKVVHILIKNNDIRDLILYIKSSWVLNFLTLLYSIWQSIFITPSPPYLSTTQLFIYLLLFFAMILSSIRIMIIMFDLLDSQFPINKNLYGQKPYSPKDI